MNKITKPKKNPNFNVHPAFVEQLRERKAHAKLNGWAELQGSQKQVDWATNVRHLKLTQIKSWMAEQEKAGTEAVANAQLRELSKIADSKFWITMRDRQLPVIIAHKMGDSAFISAVEKLTKGFEIANILLSEVTQPAIHI